ncbi:hypothetical protein F7232_04655 [Corynebacterium sp. 319]|uniref:FGGY-family carbohydrate kinase n=1 Tax=unclassified Corynebacterium TaxID=2624378 RepID=UPI00125CADFB|nr:MULTISPECIES: FGGY-family carbohydrate kinase [unclassified Corynebacterium]KAB1554257.1 hypothetical protein F7232_04655 [Corynebacterium sp. 319]KAB3539999.1 hypothetical protein F8390_01675 [Corynebacterium sp. 366]
MAPLILACDFGTTSLKAALFHPSNPTAPLRTLEAAYPTSGTTQCAEDWWAGWRRIMSSISPDAKPSIISLTGQMQDLVCTDAAGRAVAPATLYTDTSATREARVLHERLPDWERITGNEQGANSPAAMWMKGVPAGTQRVLFGPAGYIAARLGLGFHVDCTTASTTGLMDFATRSWSTRVARAAGLPMELLPEISDGVIGLVGVNDLGLAEDTQVVLAPGDAGATSLGVLGGVGSGVLGGVGSAPRGTGSAPSAAERATGSKVPGRKSLARSGYVYLGTSGWYAEILEDGQRPDWPGSFHTLALPGGRALTIAAVLSAGGTAQWARERILGGATPEEADALLMQRGGEDHREVSAQQEAENQREASAQQEAENQREASAQQSVNTQRGWTGITSLPSLHGERFPIRDDSATAALVGLTGKHTAADLYKAVLEGVALSLAPAIPAGEQHGVLPITGGGAASRPWLEIFADVVGRPVAAAPDAHASLVGAALAASEVLCEQRVQQGSPERQLRREHQPHLEQEAHPEHQPLPELLDQHSDGQPLSEHQPHPAPCDQHLIPHSAQAHATYAKAQELHLKLQRTLSEIPCKLFD